MHIRGGDNSCSVGLGLPRVPARVARHENTIHVENRTELENRIYSILFYCAQVLSRSKQSTYTRTRTRTGRYRYRGAADLHSSAATAAPARTVL